MNGDDEWMICCDCTNSFGHFLVFFFLEILWHIRFLIVSPSVQALQALDCLSEIVRRMNGTAKTFMFM